MTDRWRRRVDGSFVAMGSALALTGGIIALQWESFYNLLNEAIPLVPRAIGMLGVIPLRNSIESASESLGTSHETSALILGLATLCSGLFGIYGGRRYFRKNDEK